MAVLKADVVVIGAGAVGTAVVRELSGFDLSVVAVDRLNDIGGDASKANSAIIHTGFDAPPGTLESRLVVQANPLYDALSAELDIPFRRVGAVLVAVTEEEEAELPKIMGKARQNGVFDLKLLTAPEVLEMEPAVNPDVRAGIHVPRESIIDPFLLVVAQAENAAKNGATFITGCEVIGLRSADKSLRVATTRGEIETRFVVNAAGLNADRISGYLGIDDFRMHPRRGQFHVLDRTAPVQVQHIILPVPTKITKGKLVTPTPHGNWLIGPTAEDIDDRMCHSTTREGMEEIARGVHKLIPSLDIGSTITQYDGLRPVRTPGGYHIRSFESLAGYLELSGIRSTGVTSSVAVARYCCSKLLEMGLPAGEKQGFDGTRRGIPCFRDADADTRADLVRKDPLYAHVVCRCETVTEAEIVQAIRREPGARDVDGVKRRVRAGLGRCQGGFCGARVPQILARELGIPLEEVTKKGSGSRILTGRKKVLDEECGAW